MQSGTTAPLPYIDIIKLRNAGFTPEQIAKLEALRKDYPHQEWTDNAKQWGRLQLLKWEREHGRR